MGPIKIALAGNPNSGKTTMFNELTGANQYVGNWPGVTVEKKEGKLKGHKDVLIQDLPGIYSLSPYTLEEVVSRNYLLNETPDAIINLVDATNIERNLYLTTQLSELGIPVVIALNMMDIIQKQGDIIHIRKLSEELGCPIIETSALKGIGCKEVAEKAIEIAQQKNRQVTTTRRFCEPVEVALADIELLIKEKCKPTLLRWFAIKCFERDEKVAQDINLTTTQAEALEKTIVTVEQLFDDDSESIITSERYRFIAELMKEALVKKNTNKLSVSDKIDQIVTNRWLALPIFALVMWAVYFISIKTVGTMGTDWVNDVLFGETIPGFVGSLLETWGVAAWLQSFILDGIIGGVGAVLGFLPQMMVLFLCLAFLEDCGYMSRIAFIMDRVFRKFGLSGKSFIPILVGMGCSVPGILASRTIENEKDRKMTIMVTTFMPCGAKLPIIALIAGALFSDSSWVATSAYFIGIGAIILSGIILKKTRLFAGDPAPFVMELPAYHIPTIRGLVRSTWDRSKAFVVKAGTIIFVACGVIWFLSNFGFEAGSFGMVDTNHSLLAVIGNVIAPLFAPLGFGSWQAAVATITGLVAKENVVGTFGVLLNGLEEVSENGMEIWPQMSLLFTQVSAYSFLVFNLLCAPCFAAIGAIKREMGSAKWTMIALAWQTGLAYVVSFIVFQLGSVLLEGASINLLTALAVALLATIIFLLVRPYRKTDENNKNISAVSAQMGS